MEHFCKKKYIYEKYIYNNNLNVSYQLNKILNYYIIKLTFLKQIFLHNQPLCFHNMMLLLYFLKPSSNLPV